MAPQLKAFALLRVTLTLPGVTRSPELFLFEPSGGPRERRRCSFCMVYTWFSHMFYFQGLLAVRSTCLLLGNCVN